MLLAHGAFPLCPQELAVIVSVVPGLVFAWRRFVSWWRSDG